MKLAVDQVHEGIPDISVTADTRTWINFFAKEKNLIVSLLQRKIK
jgi:hypothetical protein